MNSRTALALVAITILFFLSAVSTTRGEDLKPDPNVPALEPITITAFGNKLILTSEDPDALAMASELVRLLTTTPSGLGDFEIIRLHHANAADTAKLLDELFNGPKPAGGGKGAQGGGRGFGGPGGGFGDPFGAALVAAGAREQRIRVVADPATNALIVQANFLDMLTIRGLLSKRLDTGNNDSGALVKTYYIGPLKNAHAIDVATILRDVYRESMNNNRRGIGQIDDPFTGNARSPAPNMDSHGNAKGVALSVGTDDKTNSLIVACPASMYEEINKLVAQLEIAAGSTKQTVKIVRVAGVDPALIQHALDAIQGRASASRTSSGGMSGMNGMGANRPGAAGQNPGGGFPGGGNFGPGFPGGNGFANPRFTPGGGGFGPGGGGGAGPGGA